MTDALSGQPENPTVWFVDLASSTAGDDWGLLIRLLALLPPREPDEPKHLVIIDAVEELETMGGSVDVHGHERSRRSRIAQVLRTAGDKCHVAFVLEETVAGSTPDEEFVTDVVIRLWAKEEYRYMRRTLEVTKARGNSHVRGHHHYLIRDGRGIADNPDEPGNQDQAYFYLVDSLHWLTRMKMISSENLEPGSETRKNKRKQTPTPQRHKEYAKLHAPKLPRTLPYNGLPRGEVTALTGDEATYKSRFARAVTLHVGDTWSAAWEATGFPGQSTAVPGRQEERLNLCASLQAYFTAHAAQESAQFGVTAALAGARFTALSDARDDVDAKTAAVTTKAQAGQATLKNLRKRVRGLIDELNTLLEADDPRWHEFGLSMPSDPDTPEAVENLVLTPNMAGKVFATWERATRATRYRVFQQVLTVDAEPMNVETVHDLQFMLAGLPTGKTVRVFIIAANDAGEAPAGAAVEAVIP